MTGEQREPPSPTYFELPGTRETDWYQNHLTDEQRANGKFSGGKLLHFQEGWAVVIGAFGKSHYFKRMVTADGCVKAACGREAPLDSMWGEGNYPRCNTCKRKRQKR